MAYKVISEFIDQDEHHYIVGDAFPFCESIEVQEDRIARLLGGHGLHSFILSDEAEDNGGQDDLQKQEEEEQKKLEALYDAYTADQLKEILTANKIEFGTEKAKKNLFNLILENEIKLTLPE